MNVDSIRKLYIYHHALHARLWDCIDHLDDAQFVQEVPYSIGSVRNHVVHLMSVDQRWLARVREEPMPDRLSYADFPTRAAARARWDPIQARILDYVTRTLTEADLVREYTYEVRRPHGTESHTSAAWQILVHVVNHGTDHRAQVLRLLHDFGAPTLEQDMIIHWWG